jgi:hypothetical protein
MYKCSRGHTFKLPGYQPRQLNEEFTWDHTYCPYCGDPDYQRIDGEDKGTPEEAGEQVRTDEHKKQEENLMDFKYVSAPVKIEAFLWEPKNFIGNPEWYFEALREGKADLAGDHLVIETLEGTMRALPGDYIIKGLRGELYPCKADVFHAKYRKCPGEQAGTFDFGVALDFLKMGRRVCRQGWNGKGMWIVMMPALELPPYNTQAPGAKVNDRTAKHIGPDTPLDSQPYFAMWTAQGQWQPGWLASQADMLAEDWMLAPELYQAHPIFHSATCMSFADESAGCDCGAAPGHIKGCSRHKVTYARCDCGMKLVPPQSEPGDVAKYSGSPGGGVTMAPRIGRDE